MNKKHAYWILTILLSLLFIYAAYSKLTQMEHIKPVTDLVGTTIMIVVSVVELILGVLLLIPKLAKLTNLLLVGLMVGATLFTIYLVFAVDMHVLGILPSVLTLGFLAGQRYLGKQTYFT